MITPINLAIEQASPADYPELELLWEASVRATHDFVREEDIPFFRRQIHRSGFGGATLYLIRDRTGILAFSGITGTHLDMLFVRPDHIGQGLGRRLIEHAIRKSGALTVDVNEQNRNAAAFYRKMGCTPIGRSATDSCGMPYPVLHLKLPVLHNETP